MSPFGYGNGVFPCVSSCFPVDMDTECFHVSMWISTWSVSMSLCGYGHGVSPCVYVDADMECLHVSMWIWT